MMLNWLKRLFKSDDKNDYKLFEYECIYFPPYYEGYTRKSVIVDLKILPERKEMGYREIKNDNKPNLTLEDLVDGEVYWCRRTKRFVKFSDNKTIILYIFNQFWLIDDTPYYIIKDSLYSNAVHVSQRKLKLEDLNKLWVNLSIPDSIFKIEITVDGLIKTTRTLRWSGDDYETQTLAYNQELFFSSFRESTQADIDNLTKVD